jgi:universal stress protein E
MATAVTTFNHKQPAQDSPMKQLRNILAIVDPTRREQPAVTKAARLAKAANARLLLFACETPYSREARQLNKHADPGAKPLPSDLQALLDEVSEPLRSDGLEFAVEHTSAAHLHPAILERACASGIDLLVKDTRHHSLAQRIFLTSTDWHLIRGCGVPLLLTMDAPWKDHPVILAALDPNHLNDKPALLDHHLLEWGTSLGALLRGTLHGVHAYVPPLLAAASFTTAAAASVTPELIANEQETRRAQLRAITEGYEIGEQALHVELGSAVDVIPRVASELQADVVVMGAIARSSARLLLIGHTAERVLERLQCDVLVVKPPDFAGCLPF